MAIERVQVPKRDEWIDGDGKLSLAGIRAIGRLADLYDLSANIDSLSVETWSWFIEFPDDKDYKVVVNAPYAVTVNSITTISTTGTCTLTGKINTTALGGTANSVSTSEQTQTHSSANSLAAADDFVLTISSNSACENVSVTVKVTRTL